MGDLDQLGGEGPEDLALDVTARLEIPEVGVDVKTDVSVEGESHTAGVHLCS